jgi:hypothetical protein
METTTHYFGKRFLYTVQVLDFDRPSKILFFSNIYFVQIFLKTFFFSTLFNTASFAASQITVCQRMLRSNLGAVATSALAVFFKS